MPMMAAAVRHVALSIRRQAEGESEVIVLKLPWACTSRACISWGYISWVCISRACVPWARAHGPITGTTGMVDVSLSRRGRYSVIQISRQYDSPTRNRLHLEKWIERVRCEERRLGDSYGKRPRLHLHHIWPRRKPHGLLGRALRKMPALLRVGRVSVATRRFVRVQLGRPQVARWPQAAR